MAATASLHTPQYRLAYHYLNKLQRANSALRRGQGNRAYWFNLIEQDWGQIKQWQAWSASGSERDIERAHLCSSFSIDTMDVLRMRQTPSENLAWVQQALEAAQRFNDDEAERILLYELSMAYLNLEMLDQADQSAHQLVVRAQAVVDELSLGRAWYVLGSSNMLRGKYDTAEEYMNKSVEILVAHHAREETARAWRVFGRIALYRGDYQQAYDYHIRYFNIVATSGNVRELGAAHIAVCGVLLFLRNYQKAEEHVLRALEIARSNGFPRMIPAALLTLAEVEKQQGKFESACIHLEEGIVEARSISPPSTVANGLYGLGQIRFLQGDTNKALAHFEEALELAYEAHVVFRICEVAIEMVIVHLARGEGNAARTRLHEALDSAMQLGTPHFMAKTLAGAVILWQWWEKHEQAALWTGLLAKYTQYLDLIWFNSTIHEQLEAELGTEHYQQALERGKTLKLNGALETIKEQLDTLTSPEIERRSGNIG